jgi:hypothetical protein
MKKLIIFFTYCCSMVTLFPSECTNDPSLWVKTYLLDMSPHQLQVVLNIVYLFRQEVLCKKYKADHNHPKIMKKLEEEMTLVRSAFNDPSENLSRNLSSKSLRKFIFYKEKKREQEILSQFKNKIEEQFEAIDLYIDESEENFGGPIEIAFLNFPDEKSLRKKSFTEKVELYGGYYKKVYFFMKDKVNSENYKLLVSGEGIIPVKDRPDLPILD